MIKRLIDVLNWFPTCKLWKTKLNWKILFAYSLTATKLVSFFHTLMSLAGVKIFCQIYASFVYVKPN